MWRQIDYFDSLLSSSTENQIETRAGVPIPQCSLRQPRVMATAEERDLTSRRRAFRRWRGVVGTSSPAYSRCGAKPTRDDTSRRGHRSRDRPWTTSTLTSQRRAHDTQHSSFAQFRPIPLWPSCFPSLPLRAVVPLFPLAAWPAVRKMFRIGLKFPCNGLNRVRSRARSPGWDRPRWERRGDDRARSGRTLTRTVVSSRQCPRDDPAPAVDDVTGARRRTSSWSRRRGFSWRFPSNVVRGRRFPARARVTKMACFHEGLHNSRSTDSILLFQVKKHGCSKLHLTARYYESRTRGKYELDGRWVPRPKSVSTGLTACQMLVVTRRRSSSCLINPKMRLTLFSRDFARWYCGAVRLCPIMCFPKIRMSNFYQWPCHHDSTVVSNGLLSNRWPRVVKPSTSNIILYSFLISCKSCMYI